MGRENGLFLRYFLAGGTEAIFQHFSLTTEDNWHIHASGLATGEKRVSYRLEDVPYVEGDRFVASVRTPVFESARSSSNVETDATWPIPARPSRAACASGPFWW